MAVHHDCAMLTMTMTTWPLQPKMSTSVSFKLGHVHTNLWEKPACDRLTDGSQDPYCGLVEWPDNNHAMAALLQVLTANVWHCHLSFSDFSRRYTANSSCNCLRLLLVSSNAANSRSDTLADAAAAALAADVIGVLATSVTGSDAEAGRCHAFTQIQ